MTVKRPLAQFHPWLGFEKQVNRDWYSWLDQLVDSVEDLESFENTVNHTTGTFVAQLQFGGANVGMTGTFAGSYTRYSNRILFGVNVLLTAKGSSTGAATIINLPTAAAANAAGGVYMDVVTPGANQLPSWHIAAAASAISLRVQDLAAGSNVAMNDTMFANTSSIVFTGHYQTAS